MRRYRLKVGDREFAIDVQELAADRYTVAVGGESYEVTLTDDEPPSAQGVSIAPRAAPLAAATFPAQKPVAASGGKGALTAPMPGVILEVMSPNSLTKYPLICFCCLIFIIYTSQINFYK